MRNIMLWTALGWLAAGMAAGVQAKPAARDLLQKIEDNYQQKTDVRATVTLTQQKTNQGVKNLQMQYYRRDKDNAFLIVMTAPEAEKGNGYLRLDDNFWMYRRNTRSFQHINRDENIGGSDAHGDDFESRRLTEMFQPASDTVAEEKLGQIPVYRFEARATVNDVSYPKLVFWVRQDNSLVLKQESYALSGTLMQTAYFLKYTSIQGKFVPVKQMFIDEFEKGNKTIMELADIATAKLEDHIFTKAYLENLSK